MATAETQTITSIVDKNVKHIEKVREEQARDLTAHDKFADSVASFAGSIRAVYFHFAVFGLWIAFNSTASHPFDPYPFTLLGTFACIEAIFLSTFVLVNQARMSRSADLRADLELQMTLLTEHELTRLIRATTRLAEKMGVDLEGDVAHVKEDVQPEKIIERIERAAVAAPKTI